MGQENQKPKIVPTAHDSIVVDQPMVRDYATGGGHLPGDTLIEGDDRIETEKWQGYPPVDLNVVGKALPPMPEVSIPRFTGRAEYATRVWLPDMLYAKVLTCPHPRARVQRLDPSIAERMSGVRYVLTHQNAPTTYPLPEELNFQGDVVAIVAAETEDLAEDAVAAIEVDYEILPFASTVEQVMSVDAPDLRQGQGNLIRVAESSAHYDPEATWVAQHGDVEEGFREADVIREFTYHFAGATAVPIQPCGGVAQWDGDNLKFWGMGQSIYPSRDTLARQLGIDRARVRYINRYNGCTFGAANAASSFNAYVAHIARMTNRPVKLMLPKEQELGHITIKPENVTRFKVGATNDGRIVALTHEIYISGGDQDRPIHATSNNSKHNTALYTVNVPHWKEVFYIYRTNVIRAGICRSHTQQEIKWAWENMMDEMAEAVRLDPIRFRLMHISRPGMKLTSDWEERYGELYELEDGAVTFDSFASVEVLEEGAKAFGWDQRNPEPGGNPGRWKKGMGVGMSLHHPGHMGYHEGEIGFERRIQQTGGGGIFSAELELNAQGDVTMKNALPDSGTNHDTALAHLVAEILGFTTRDQIRVIWGDSDLAPPTGTWVAGKTITVQGAAVCSAADKLRENLLRRAAATLNADVTTLEIRDGVIRSTTDAGKQTSFAELVQASGGRIRETGRGIDLPPGRALTRGVGACFVEVEVDTWTGNWRFLKSVYSHDTGLVVNPLVAESDMYGSLTQSTQIATEAIPWDREFPGTRHYSVGYLSYRLPTIMDVPAEQTQVFVNSLEPRWFFGTKSFSETTIGAVPGALSNAIYNACGVRIREHPITRDKIMAGLKASA